MNQIILEEKFLRMIKEDLGSGDITTELIPNSDVKAEIIVKEDCIISGVYELKTLFNLFNIQVHKSAGDAKAVEKQQRIFLLSGKVHDILLVERTALNILSRMSGITSLTQDFVLTARKKNPRIRVAATRKTTPLFGYFEKKAVKLGGGDPHRHTLSDMILIKDNHLKLFGDVRKAIRKAKKESVTHKIEIEVNTIRDAITAAEEKTDTIMLDNMTVEQVKETISQLKEKNLRDAVLIEVSGGITLENISQYASCEPDIISVGMLTHSAKSKDFSFRIL